MTAETVRWDAVTAPGVLGVIAGAARRIRQDDDLLERDDLEQEAAIALATKSKHRRELVDDAGELNLGILDYRMKCAMRDVSRTPRRRRTTFRMSSYECLSEDSLTTGGHLQDLSDHGGYSPAAVRELLTAMLSGADVSWGGTDWGVRDQPLRARRTSWGYRMAVVDVRTAWDRVGLTTQQRRALLLDALGFTQEEAGQLMGGVGRSTVNEHIQKGAQRLVDYLTGEPPEAGGASALRAA
jgi:hypothetical protein